MIFTPEEIQKFFDIIDYRLARIVADVLGVGILTPEDKELLTRNGYEWKKELEKIPPYYQSYLFGKLSAVLTPTQLNSIDYGDFTSYIDKKQFKTLSAIESAVYNAAATRTYSYIKSMGARVKDTVNNSISQEEMNILTEKQKQLEHAVIKKELIDGVVEKKSVKAIVSNIGHSLNNWNKDWGRIVETELQNIYQIGIAQTIMEEHGPESYVYKEVYPGACKNCLRLYTTGGTGTRPRIFKLIDLISNGDNIGLKVKDWKPTLYSTHPYCRCQLYYIPKGYVWDEDLKMFAPPKEYKRKIERKSKVKIYVGDKMFEV